MNQPKIRKFEDLLAWQKARSLSVEVYEKFGYMRDYGFKDQITRSAVSIMSNIAEGYERGGDRELRRFLLISRGSCAETRSLLILAGHLGYIDLATQSKMLDDVREVGRLITGLIKVTSPSKPIIYLAIGNKLEDAL